MVWTKFRWCEQNFQECDQHLHGVNKIMTVCFFVLCNRHWFNRVPDPPPRDRLGVTYLPFAFSSDAGYADLPLALLGAPAVWSWKLMVWTKFRWCEQNFQECDQHLHGVNKIMTVWSWKLMVWTKFRWCEQNFQECDQHLHGVNKIMTVWSWKLMVWTNIFRCDQMLMVWWNDISVWTNVHFLEIVWSHRMVWCLHMFFPDEYNFTNRIRQCMLHAHPTVPTTHT